MKNEDLKVISEEILPAVVQNSVEVSANDSFTKDKKSASNPSGDDTTDTSSKVRRDSQHENTESSLDVSLQKLKQEDEEEFCSCLSLSEIFTAPSDKDVAALQRSVTPEVGDSKPISKKLDFDPEISSYKEDLLLSEVFGNDFDSSHQVHPERMDQIKYVCSHNFMCSMRIEESSMIPEVPEVVEAEKESNKP